MLFFIGHNKYVEVFYQVFFKSSLSHIWVISVRGNALKIQQKYTPVCTIATVGPISIFHFMV